MVSKKCLLLAALVGLAAATPIDSMLDEMRVNCDNGVDPLACGKLKVMSLLDTVSKTDNYQISGVEVQANGYNNANTGRSAGDFLDSIQSYIQGHDVSVQLPLVDAKLTMSPRNLDNDELNLSVKFDKDVEGKSRKHKKNRLKRLAMPIMTLILLKSMTIIPMAIGILGLKAFNALKLGFLSFVFSVGLAIFQLCKKVMS
ncbi:Osi19 family protein [Megaselia abdita]